MVMSNRDFILSGKAVFTVVSGKTGRQWTFRVDRIKTHPKAIKVDPWFFVHGRQAPRGNWTLLGTLLPGDNFLPQHNYNHVAVDSFLWTLRNADRLEGKAEFIRKGGVTA
jgi:hypothetical protein